MRSGHGVGTEWVAPIGSGSARGEWLARLRPPGGRMRTLRWCAFAALLLPVAPLAWQAIVPHWADPVVTQQQCDEWLARRTKDRSQQSGRSEAWAILDNARVAFDRLTLDLQARFIDGERYFDAEYAAAQMAVLQASIDRKPRLAFHLLAHYALLEDRPLQQAVAILTIRECYPKKFSIFFATRFASSADPVLANLCRAILSGRYRPGGLERKLRPSTFESLARWHGEPV